MSCFRTYVSQLTLQIRQRHLDISPVELGWNIKFGALVSGHDSILLAVYLKGWHNLSCPIIFFSLRLLWNSPGSLCRVFINMII